MAITTSKKHLFLCLYLLIFNTCAAAYDDTGNANAYIDEVLKNLRETPSVVAEIDPLKIPDFDEGKIKGSNGIVRGLSSLYRHGDCTVTYENDVATVAGQIAVRDVNLNMNYKVKALFFWIKGYIEGRLGHLAVKLELTAKEGKAHLESFKVVDMGELKINKITGMSVVFNWALKLIANSMVKKSRGKIVDALEKGAANAINDALKKVQVPF